MNDELTARQRAISLRLAGRSVKQICSALGRGETWFRTWTAVARTSGAVRSVDSRPVRASARRKAA